ncbi:MAG TPA: tetratricopeptide repeat protein, partial [Burkholderiaceae bacterium]
MKIPLVRFILAAALALALPHAGFAADTPTTAAAPDKLSQARSFIKDKKWAEAIDELKRVGDTGSA